MRIPARLVVFLLLVLSCLAQERFTWEFGGRLRGFTKPSPYDHYIHEFEEPFVVRSVRGVILHGAYDEPVPLVNVLFEIRGPGSSMKVRGTKTDKRGRFKIGGLREGEYLFMVTLNGFRPMFGTIVVCKSTDPKKTIRIEMVPS